MDLSIVVVSFNTKELLGKCLRSVFASATTYSFEVLVVDNASADQSAEMVEQEFPAVKLTRNVHNVGYAKANNKAIKLASGRHLLLLNSDVEIMPDTLQKMLDYIEGHPEAGIAGPRVVREDGTLDLACRRSFPTPASALWHFLGLSFLFPRFKLSSYNLTYLPEDVEADVDSVMGAFLLIRRAAVEKIGLLDEDYFMYGEDMDWCFRTKAAGWAVRYVPAVKVVHHKGSSSRKIPGKALYEFHRAMSLFYDKHYRRSRSVFTTGAVKTGIWFVYLIKSIINGMRREKFVSK